MSSPSGDCSAAGGVCGSGIGIDLRCYFVTGSAPEDMDPVQAREHIASIAGEAAAGGAGVVQVRSKPISVRDLTALAISVAAAVAEANPATRVLIDDRVDVAAALMGTHHIHGVHIGQDDLDPRWAREVLGPEAIIGLTTGTLELVEAANEYAEFINYIGAGPYRPTPTKNSGRDPLGLEGYPPLVEASAVPVIAIGDVRGEDATALAATGVAGVAIVRGFMNSADPAGLARQVVRAFADPHSDRDSEPDLNPAPRGASGSGPQPSFAHLVVGAGIIGLSTAFELLEAGVPPADIAIVDPEPTSGVTHVAGGMLAPVAEVQYRQEALYPLMVASGEMYPDLLQRVKMATDTPTGHRTESTLVVGADRADGTHVRELTDVQREHGMDVRTLTLRQARSLEPGLSPQLAAAVEIPGDHQVNPRMLSAALLNALRAAGVQLVRARADRVDGQIVRLSNGAQLAGDVVYLCNGLGAADVRGWWEEQWDSCPLALRPVRGDLLRLRVPDGTPPPVSRVVRAFVEDRPVYAIPRTDGTIAIGATSREDARTEPAVDGVHTLLRDAIRVLPGLEDFEFIEALAGARPGTPDDLPYLGMVREGLVVSTGYFRHGILLTALGARAGVALGLGREVPVDIGACDPLRHVRGNGRPPTSARAANPASQETVASPPTHR